MFELVSAPAAGRIFDGAAAVRLGDSSPGGRVRLDALARHLQDISDDDARAAGFGSYTWVVRRTVLVVHSFPTYLERFTLRTWCSGFGAAWAERRVEVVGERGGRVEAATLWVHLDGASMRPSRMPDEFLWVFGPSAASRRVGSKPLLPAAPADEWVRGAPWPLRFADFDVLEHVNNAAYWAAVEQHLSTRRDLRAPFTAVIEHGDAIERGYDVRWSAVDRAESFDGWLLGADGEQFAAVRVSAGV
ncbi:MAG: thioesterase [Actinomycetota bacterium]|nr:thioesterase [Actinomycetota bacterium]